jgi:opacity protein-like surface antigen
MRVALAVLAALCASPALAQDWGGFHIGGSVEGTAAGIFSSGTLQETVNGLRVNGEIGYDLQLGPVVAGVRAEAGIGTLSAPVDVGGTTVSWLPGTTVALTGRAGVAFGAFLPYAFGGVLMGMGSSSAATTGQSVGATAGVGLEAQVFSPLSLRTELRWTGRTLPELTALAPPGETIGVNEIGISLGALMRF